MPVVATWMYGVAEVLPVCLMLLKSVAATWVWCCSNLMPVAVAWVRVVLLKCYLCGCGVAATCVMPCVAATCVMPEI